MAFMLFAHWRAGGPLYIASAKADVLFDRLPPSKDGGNSSLFVNHEGRHSKQPLFLACLGVTDDLITECKTTVSDCRC